MILAPSRTTASSHYGADSTMRAKTHPDNVRMVSDALPGWLSAVDDKAAWITLHFDRDALIESCAVQNGWAEHGDDWSLHGRARHVEFLASDVGCLMVEMPDTRDEWSVALPGFRGRRLTLLVHTSYPARFNVVGLGRLRIEGEWV